MNETTEIDGATIELKGTKENGYKVWAVTPFKPDAKGNKKQSIRYLGIVKLNAQKRWVAMKRGRPLGASKLRREAIRLLGRRQDRERHRGLVRRG